MSWNELLLDLESYMERYRRALDEIANSEWCNSQESLDKIQGIAQAALDGEPTTADEYNSDEITELVKNYPNDMQLGSEIRTLVNTDLKEYVISNSGASHDTSKQS